MRSLSSENDNEHYDHRAHPSAFTPALIQRARLHEIHDCLTLALDATESTVGYSINGDHTDLSGTDRAAKIWAEMRPMVAA